MILIIVNPILSRMTAQLRSPAQKAAGSVGASQTDVGFVRCYRTLSRIQLAFRKLCAESVAEPPRRLHLIIFYSEAHLFINRSVQPPTGMSPTTKSKIGQPNYRGAPSLLVTSTQAMALRLRLFPCQSVPTPQLHLHTANESNSASV